MNYKRKRESSRVNDVVEKVEEIDLAEKETNLNVTNKIVEYGFDETLVEMRRLEKASIYASGSPYIKKDVSVDSEVKHVKGESVVNDISDENNDYKKKNVHLDIGEGKDLVPENKNIEYVVDALKGVLKKIDVEENLVPENTNVEYVVDEALKGVKRIDVENVHLDIEEGKDLVHRIENSEMEIHWKIVEIVMLMIYIGD